MLEKKIRPVWPVYAAGGIWILGGILLPLYTLWGIGLTAVLSLAAFLIFSKFAPVKTILVPAPEVPLSTGDAAADKILASVKEQLHELSRLNQEITDPALSAQMDRMEHAGRGILSEVQKHPKKAEKIEKYASFYLPTAIKVLTSYAKMSGSNAQGENASAIMRDVESNAALIASAFENQLDSLFGSEMMDITTDIEVLTNLMKSDNLLKANEGKDTI